MEQGKCKTVYHYCGIDAFYEIISDKMLRLSDIDKSNDYMERKWLQRFIQETAMEEYEKTPFDLELVENDKKIDGKKAVSALIECELKATGKHWYDDLITYAICFSEENDSLSQWRGYADDGYGVSIGFCADRISEKLIQNRETDEPGHTFQFQPIRYDEKAQKDMIRPYIRQMFVHLQAIARREETPSGQIIGLFRAINGESAFCKNPAFGEEKEWRLAVNFPLPTWDAYTKFKMRADHVAQNDLFSRIKTVVVGKTIKSYVELNLKTLGTDAITEICLGPKCKLTKNDVKLFLCSEKMWVPDENINTSKATYR
ncbi:MAG: DUF2971 domain-containing protein [Christensenella sp.]|nr:DUF2971 domain-containing protein [Christensenella sp.]